METFEYEITDREAERRERGRELANEFVNVFERTLARENVENFEKDLSDLFEFIARSLSGEGRFSDADGVTGLTVSIRKPKQADFKGKMWVLGHNTSEALPFEARVTDKRITKQGIWIKIRIGSHVVEGELFSILDLD